MRIGVFSRLCSRLFCFIPERLTVQTEKFPGDDELAEAATSFESGIEGSEIRNRGGKKDAAGLHRHLAWIAQSIRLRKGSKSSFDMVPCFSWTKTDSETSARCSMSSRVISLSPLL